MTTKVWGYLNDDGDAGPIEFPATFAVCDLCEGHGTHTNPSIDFNGLDTSNMDHGEIDAYFNGAYDQICRQCNGKRVIPVIDRNRADERDLEGVDQYARDQYAYEQEREAERRFGC